MTGLVLHYAPDNASLCVRLALDTLGLPFRTRLVDRSRRAQTSPAYLALNPNGQIPVLETPQGVLFETAAVLLWCDRQKPGVLLQDNDQLVWLMWLTNTLHPALQMLFYPRKFMPDDALTLRRAMHVRISERLTLLDAAPTAGFLDVDRLTLPACYLAPMLRWCGLYGGDTTWFRLTDYPRLLRFAQMADTTPAAQTAQRAEGLGPTPFSAPIPPRPPEGTAL